MKLLFSLIYLLFFSIYCFCQESVDYYDIKDGLEIKNGIFLKSTPKGGHLILPEITNYSHQLFNKYGNLVVDGVDGSEFVIDYNGNYIIPPTKGNTRVKEVYEGLYQVYGHGGNTQKEFEENQHCYNFYNQKGEKLIPERVVKLYYNSWYLKVDDFKFLACKNFNLILYNNNKRYGNYILMLDEENRIIKDRF